MGKKYFSKPILILVTFVLTFGQSFQVLAESVTASENESQTQTSLVENNKTEEVKSNTSNQYQSEPSAQQDQKKLPGLSGSFLVDGFSGAATHSYPINIPKGVNGVQPSLGLSYNSHLAGQNGSVVGSGWALTQSVITRQNKAGTVNLYNGNYYSLQIFGEQINLVPVDLAQGIFAPEIESDTWQIKNLGSQGWQVSDKNGWIYVFGDTSATRQFDAGNQQNIYSWWLKKVSDPNGNSMEFSYFADNGQLYPKAIEYTKFNDQSGRFEIRFQPFFRGPQATDIRPDIFSSYVSAYKIETKYRLQNIEIWSNNQKTSQYDFSYITGQNNKTSLLKSIQSIGYDNNGQEASLPKTNFDYTQKQSGYTDVTSQYPVGGWEGFAYGWPYNDTPVNQLVEFNGDSWMDRGPSVFDGLRWIGGSLTFPEQINNNQLTEYLNKYSLIGDFNGDSKNDLIYSLSNGANNNKMWLNAGDHFEPGWILPPFFYNYNWNIPMTRLALADVNSDGLADIVYSFQQDNSIGFPEVVKDIWLNTGSEFVKGYGQFPVILARCAINAFWNCPSNGVQLIDINNDGLVDVVADGRDVYLNNGKSFSQQPDSQWTLPSMPTNFGEAWRDGSARFVDLNSDGLVDITVNKESYYYENGHTGFHYYATSYLNTGNGWQKNDAWNVPEVMGSSGNQFRGDLGVRLLDINNDGSFDVIKKYCSSNYNGCLPQPDNPDKVWQSQSGKANLLNRVSVESNGLYKIDYEQSARIIDEQGRWLNNKLPISLPVVKLVTEYDGLGGSNVTSYQYAYGHFYVDSQFPNNNQFSGFGVITIESGSKKIKKYFHQGGGFDGSLLGENEDAVALRGRQYREEVYSDNSGQEKLENISIQKWTRVANDNRSKVYLDSTSNFNNANELVIAQAKSNRIFEKAVSDYVKPVATEAVSKDVASDKIAKLINSQAQYLPEISDSNARHYYLGKGEEGYDYLGMFGVTTSGDGNICVKGNLFTPWSDLVNASSGVLINTEISEVIVNRSMQTKTLCRVFFPFDTSSLPDEANISTTTLSFSTIYGAGLSNMNVVKVSPNDPSNISGNDFSKFGNEVGATYYQQYWPTRISVNLVNEANNWVSLSGKTVLGLRTEYDMPEQSIYGNADINSTITSSRFYGINERPTLLALYTMPNQSLRPSNLETNDEINPASIKPPISFSAIYHSDNVASLANYYRLQVVKENNDFNVPLWDSGKQLVNDMVGINERVNNMEYLGPDLPYDGTTYKWRVKFWNNNNEEGLWSTELATFSARLIAEAIRVEYDYNQQTNQLITEESLGKEVVDIMSGELIEHNLGDEQTTTYSYAIPVSPISNIKTAVKEVEVTAGAKEGALKRQAYYDNLPLGQVAKLNKTKDDLLQNNINYKTEYNEKGQPVKTIDPKGNTTTIVYDESGLYPRFTINALGQQIETKYDLKTGQVIRQVDSNGLVEEKDLDAFGRVVKVRKSSALGNGELQVMAEIIYNDLSMPRSVNTKSRSGLDSWQSSYEYFDGLGRQVQTRTQAGANKFTVVSSLYDNLGRVVKKTLPYFDQGPSFTTEAWAGPKVSYAYDALDRPLTETTPVGVTTYAYDGLTTVVIDPNGHQKDYVRDAYDRLVEVKEHNQGEVYLTKYEYNVLGKITKITDAQGNSREFTYDSLGRLVTQTDMHKPDSYGQIWSYAYDSASNLTEKITANGGVIRYEYDALNRMVRETTDDRIVDYSYDLAEFGIGRLNRIEGQDFTKNFQYNLWGQVIDEIVKIKGNEYHTGYEHDALGRLLTINYPDEFLVRYSYDQIGQLDSVYQKEPERNEQKLISSIEHNPIGQVAKINYTNGLVTEYVYDPSQAYRLIKKSTTNSSNEKLQDFIYTYDPVGNILTLSDYGQTKTSKEVNYTYDDLDRLVTSNIRDLVGVNNESQEYKYDAIGNILNKSDIGDYSYGLANPHQAGLIGRDEMTYDLNGNLTRDGKNSYAYDSRDKMVGVVSNDSQKDSAYLYDQSGQRLWKISADNSVKVNNLDAIISTAPVTSPEIIPTIDNNASTQEVIVDNNPAVTDVPTTTTEVINNSPQALDVGPNTISSNPVTSDVDQTQLTSPMESVLDKSVSLNPEKSSPTEVYYPNQYFEVELKGGSQTVTHHIYAGSERIAQDVGNKDSSSLNYILTDHLGSTHLILDENGKVISQYDYYPFGSIRVEIDGKDNKREFIGKVKDSETGLSYDEARYLDSNVGRFTQSDPLALYLANDTELKDKTGKKLSDIISNPQILNSYAYAHNNPVKLVDSNGQFAFIPVIMAAIWLGFTVWDSYNAHQTYNNPNASTGEKAFNYGMLALDFTPVGLEKDAVRTVSAGVKSFEIGKNVLEHVIEGDARGGAHVLGNAEKSGKLVSSVRTDLATGISYGYEVMADGFKQLKTYFPESWSADAIKQGLEKLSTQGKVISTYANDAAKIIQTNYKGITVQGILDTKGVIKTFFPVARNIR